MKSKEEYRRLGKREREHLTREERRQKSAQIAGRLFALPEYKEADALAIYASIGSEVETYGIMEHALADGKRVFCPKVLSVKEKKMEFYAVTSPDELRVSGGTPAIPEPAGDTLPLSKSPLSRILFLLPGLAFNREGDRIGYGGGFYDAYLRSLSLSKCPQVTKGRFYCHLIALAFSCQLLAEPFPTSETDIPVHTILTERENLFFSR